MDIKYKDIHVLNNFNEEIMTYRQIESEIKLYRSSVSFEDNEGKRTELVFPNTYGIKIIID